VTETKQYYRSLKHLENEAEVLAMMRKEFPEFEPEKLSPVSRRRFVQLLGASAALASATGCRWETEKIVDENTRSENRTPGVAQYFSSAMELGGVAYPLRVSCYDGRPIKAEGNPNYAPYGGAATTHAYASLLEMYDPDRRSLVTKRSGGTATESDFAKFAAETGPNWQALRSKQGEGLRVLAGATSSSTLADVRRRFETTYPKAKWHEWEALSGDESREGARLAFGAVYRPLYDLAAADVVVCLDCDLLGEHPNSMAHSRAFATRRDPDAGSMSRLYAVEAMYSATGAAADHRLPLRSHLIGAFLLGLEEALQLPGAPGASSMTGDSKAGHFIRALAGDLKAAGGKSLIVIGPHQPAAVQARVHRLNEMLGGVGTAVRYVKEQAAERATHFASIQELAADMAGDKVDTLVMLGGNPVYDAPVDCRFGEALAKVKTKIHLSLYDDETSAASDWHLPMAHYLESWGDARTYDGTHVLIQPTLLPLYDGKSAIELIAMLGGDELSSGQDLVRRAFDALYGGDETMWRRSLRDGIVAIDSARVAPETPKVAANLPPMPAAGSVEDELQNGQLEVNFAACPKVYDGRFANNGWLQEMPEFMTRQTWDNVALIGVATAKRLGVTTEQMATFKLGDRSLDCAVYVMPGHAQSSVTFWLGYGRTRAGAIGGHTEKQVASVGFDTYKLRGASNPWFASGLTVTPKAETYKLAQTQEHHMMDEVGMQGREERVPMLIHETEVGAYKADPKAAHPASHSPPLVSLWDPPEKYETGHKWGLSVDLTTCTGCNACVIACQAENNVPVVGKERVWRSREMHWMRIDRYFTGDVDDPAVASQPVMCQQCENAPCEEVCPVGATMHSKEGLNDMVYNRCVGTRYCSNNCPYKVRRFNFFNYHLKIKEDPSTEILKMLFNPEVTVRARGVMEKCTYCTHRISAARAKAKNERRDMRDGDVITACQQACPSQSIVFGDLNDANSRVSKKHANPRAYAMLDFLNIKPRTLYMARISNRNPALVKPKAAAAHGGH
jgi:MoCo/4Fe-4S cofactor protein with predicted Tat translocation signal